MSKRYLVNISWAIAFTLLVALAPASRIVAQEEQTESANSERNEQQQAESEADQTETEQSEGGEEGEEDASGQDDSLGGFVPSEQISEDLSVSFPVDI